MRLTTGLRWNLLLAIFGGAALVLLAMRGEASRSRRATPSPTSTRFAPMWPGRSSGRAW